MATLNFATADSSAWAGTHYTAANGTLTWTDGESGTKTVTVPVINTSASQPPRQFKVSMSSPSSGTSLSVNSSVAVLIEDATATLPAPWSQAIVSGITDYSSAVMVANVLYSLTVGGTGLASGSTYDAGQFVYQNRTGDGILTAYFPAGVPSDSSARYAVMVRASTANNAVMAATVTSSNTGYGTRLITRGSSGGSASALPSAANALVLNRWVRLTRTGSVFTSETSADGVSWTSLGSVTLDALPDEALWGVFHYSSDWSITSLGNYQLATAQNIVIDDVPAPEIPTGVVATATCPSLCWA